MRRDLSDVLRRGFDNALANWQLVLIRVVETALAFGIAIAAVIAVVVPLVISAHLGNWESLKNSPASFWPTIMTIVTEHWMLWLYLLLIASVVIAVILAIHSAVEAGSARIYVDAERAAAISRTQTRERFEAFNMDRFLAGVREGWWRVFWIYNAAWTLGGLVILAPLAVLALIIAAIGTNAAAIVIGCFFLLAMCLILFFVGLLTSIWVQGAIVAVFGRGLGGNAALRYSWREISGDLGRYALVAIIFIAVSFAGSSMLNSFSSGVPVNGGSIQWQLLLTSPLLIASSFLQTIFSSAVASWFLASITAIQQENPS